MTRVRLPLFALLLLPAAAPAPSADALGQLIHRKLAERGPWFSPAERRFVAARCGQSEDQPLRIEDDRMICADGRVVRDPRVRTMARDVEARATARVHAVMAAPEIRAATRATADRAVRDVLAGRSLAPDGIAPR